MYNYITIYVYLIYIHNKIYKIIREYIIDILGKIINSVCEKQYIELRNN